MLVQRKDVTRLVQKSRVTLAVKYLQEKLVKTKAAVTMKEKNRRVTCRKWVKFVKNNIDVDDNMPYVREIGNGQASRTSRLHTACLLVKRFPERVW